MAWIAASVCSANPLSLMLLKLFAELVVARVEATPAFPP